MSPLNPEEQAWETIAERYGVNWRRVRNLFDTVYFAENGEIPNVSKVTDEDLEKLSDIKELLENALYQPLSSSEIEGNTQAALDLVNKMIGEWSE
jgi:hypothetical protein